VTGYVPGALGRILELQESFYVDGWGFDFEFVRWTATELVTYLDQYDKATDRLVLGVDPGTTREDGTILGSVVVHGDRDVPGHAQLRWFIVDPEARGIGFGRRLFERAMAFCESTEVERVSLTTIEGLDAAIHLYEDYGFDLVERRRQRKWEQDVVFVRYEAFL